MWSTTCTPGSTRGWGAHLQELTASGIWTQDQSQLHINVLELQAIPGFSVKVPWAFNWFLDGNENKVDISIVGKNGKFFLINSHGVLRRMGAVTEIPGMAWPKSFQPESGECKGCTVRQHVSGCLPEKIMGGTKSLLTNEKFSHRHMFVGREEGNDTSSPSLSRTSECVSGPSITEGSNPQDRMEPKPDHSRQDISCLGQTIRGSVSPKDKHEIGNVHLPIREEMSWKVDSLVQNWDGMYAYAYPPTSLIRACINKVRTENVEIVLMASGWPNQEWFPDLLDLPIDFPITLQPVQKLLKQTFSHHFHLHPWLLNLHAWRLSRDSTRREDFLKRLPRGSLYLRDNPQRGFTRVEESGAMLSRLILSRQLSNSS